MSGGGRRYLLQKQHWRLTLSTASRNPFPLAVDKVNRQCKWAYLYWRQSYVNRQWKWISTGGFQVGPAR